MSEAVIVVHGGAGSFRRFSEERERSYRAGLTEACRVGMGRGRNGASALDMVEAAVRVMEASAAFNAGVGSCLTLEKELELDGAIACGERLEFGAVGGMPGFRHPVSVARWIMEETDHNFLVAEGAARVARTMGAETLGEPTEERLEQYARLRQKLDESVGGGRLDRLRTLLRTHPELAGQDTVGAVACDREGRLASACSTGGLWLKLPGRVGDSPIFGAGLYADAAAAASGTGVGEAIMRTLLCRDAVGRVEGGIDPQTAAEAAVERMGDRIGDETGGLILVDASGRIGMAFNTNGMGRAVLRENEDEPRVAVFPDG